MRIIYLSLLFLLASCYATNDGMDSHIPPHETFGDYWYNGTAEISTYALEQSRYGEMREGHAVLVYVTEDFSAEKQVKLDNPSAGGNDVQKVLKLNKLKKFNTGVYRYSMMSSVFSPVDGSPHALKTTVSSQEWCGHTWMQVNRRDGRLQFNGYSYFEQEGDRRFSLAAGWMEDELWNLIRLNPEALPTGELQIIPSGFFMRLEHVKPRPFQAEARIDLESDTALYTLHYGELDRTLAIRFESAAPYAILSWEESYPGRDGNRQTSRAVLKEQEWLDYWNKNGTEDAHWRTELGIE